MKKTIGILLLALSATVSAKNIVVNGTRFIYPAGDKEVTVQLNNTANRPALVQTWLDTGNPEQSPDTITTPFSITPPITRVDGNAGQTLRIRAINKAGIPTDRESIWWLNILEIPPKPTAAKAQGESVLQLAIRSRFKFIYRPENLGDRDNAAEKLVLKAQGKNLRIDNPTPFFITVSKITKGTGVSLNSAAVMIAPKSTQTVSLKAEVRSNEKLTVSNINDYGSDTETPLTTN
ncbi:chaperone protein MrkB-like [Bactrocera neohumeralis]|uniref:chaperone protein MrkB-like n=1 Tax=Bactrocera neohumeralis TaxID=98809 RepID=UPI002166BD8D|nr:chaperone protein MrkB-like [Bactrocera neohumeralis]